MSSAQARAHSRDSAGPIPTLPSGTTKSGSCVLKAHSRRLNSLETVEEAEEPCATLPAERSSPVVHCRRPVHRAARVVSTPTRSLRTHEGICSETGAGKCHLNAGAH
jgi:hypothetical protein